MSEQVKSEQSSMAVQHCKTCMALDECDVPGCPNRFLVERRQPETAAEVAVAERLRAAMEAM